MVVSVYRKNHEKGQGLVEYALIMALLAIVVIVSLKVLGPAIGNVFSEISSSLSGEDGGPPVIETPTPAPTPTPTWIFCANENYFCNFSGTALVRYGAYDTWVTGTYTNGVLCANSVFGDPLYGTYKSCQYSQ
jgi:Flp pilus assembly pilin Flp